MAKFKKNFISKVYLACGKDELRTQLNYVIFEEGCLVATNAHVLVKQKLELHGFDEEEIKLLEGKKLHYETVKEIMRYDIVSVKEGKFVCHKGNVKGEFELLDKDNYPNYKAVIPSGEGEDLSEIGFNLSYMNDIKNLMLDPAGTGNVVMKIFGSNKAILMRSYGLSFSEETLLIMPTRIDQGD